MPITLDSFQQQSFTWPNATLAFQQQSFTWPMAVVPPPPIIGPLPGGPTETVAMDIVSSIQLDLDALTALIAADLATPSMILFSNVIGITKTLHVSDLTECTFTGYAAKTLLVASAAYIGGDGIARFEFPTVLFQAANPLTVTDNVAGFAIVNAGKTLVYGAALLPGGPIAMSVPLQGLPIDASIAWGM